MSPRAAVFVRIGMVAGEGSLHRAIAEPPAPLARIHEHHVNYVVGVGEPSRASVSGDGAVAMLQLQLLLHLHFMNSLKWDKHNTKKLLIK